MTVDTSAEAVERLAAHFERGAEAFPAIPQFSTAFATLRALLAERDNGDSALENAVQAIQHNHDEWLAMKAERDAARAEVAQWKQAHGLLKVEIAKQRAAKRSHRQRAETAERKAAVAKARAALGGTNHG